MNHGLPILFAPVSRGSGVRVTLLTRRSRRVRHSSVAAVTHGGHAVAPPRYQDDEAELDRHGHQVPAFLPQSRDERYEYDDQEQDARTIKPMPMPRRTTRRKLPPVAGVAVWLS